VSDIGTHPNALLTVTEVATFFRVHPQTVTRWTRTGRLPVHRTPGGQYRFRVSEVQAYLASEAAPGNGAGAASHPTQDAED
jgi:excisionase family DNA binding protein